MRYTGLSLLWPLPLRSTGSGRTGSAAMAHGPSRSAACGIFPDRGTNPCPLHRQADSQPLCHQGSPRIIFKVLTPNQEINIRLDFRYSCFLYLSIQYSTKYNNAGCIFLILFLIFYLFSFWPRCVACGILVPWQGIEPGPSAVKAPCPNHCTAREFPDPAYKIWWPLR